MGRQRNSSRSQKPGYGRSFRKQTNVQRLGRAIRKYVRVETQEADHSFVSNNKKGTSRKMARKQARQKKKARRNHKNQEVLPEHPPQGHGTVEEVHGRRKRRAADNADAKGASGLKGSSQISHTSSNLSEVGPAQQRLDSDEREVRRLEKLLGMNKRKGKNKLPASFAREGLDYILAVTEPNPVELSDEEDHVWLKTKRAKVDRQKTAVSGKALRVTARDVGVNNVTEPNMEERSVKEDVLDDSANVASSESCSDLGSSPLDEGSDGYLETESESTEDDSASCDKVGSSAEESESDEVESGGEAEVMQQLAALKEQRRQGRKEKGKGDGRVEGGAMGDEGHGGSKYVPPRVHSKGVGEGGERVQLQLKKKLNGLVNRLSEANLPSILTQVEQMYRNNSRNDMNTALSQVLIQACVQPTLLPSRLPLEHMALVAALNVRVGSEVGAHLLQEIAVQFSSQLEQEGSGKEVNNLLLLLSHLYNFKVVHCMLVYDVIRKLMESLTERNIELLLLVLTNVGMAIRKDDPAALKEIIGKVQSKSSSECIESPRMRFMLETMVALRTNNPRKIPHYDPSQVEHMTKFLRALLPPGSLTEARLKISLHDLLHTDKQGRWWVVGSAWTGRESTMDKDKAVDIGCADPWVLELAKKHGMNTDVRKNVFCILMTSEDYVDAFEKLLKLNLKEVQEREVIHVVVVCCLKERTYNPYYAHLGQKLCQYKKANQVTFQYAIWDRLKMLASLSQLSVNNLWRLVSHLVAHKALSLGVLRVVEFAQLDKTGLHFHRSLLQSLLCDYSEETCRAVFARIATLPQLRALREALLLFLHHFLKEDTSHAPDLHHSQPQLPFGSHHAHRNTPLINMRIKLAEDALKPST